jgi:iron complex outermembrane receptor protein
MFRLSALACAMGLAFPLAANAQSAPAPAAAASATTTTTTTTTTLAPVVVTGNPLGSNEIATPASVLEGDALVLRRGSTLGETLNSLPGVSSSYFGPNASRPIIRGLDGDRVRMLNNGGASLDASSLSFDHAVPIDPLVVDRIEVLRGPAALLYGGSAIGGVVNSIDNRIPKVRVDGVDGAVEARFGGADAERGGAALVESGNASFAVHADVFGRKTDDLHVPEYTPIEDGTPLARTNRVRNSASRSDGGALGGSLLFDRGYLGVSVDTYDSKYGTVAEPDVTIQMKRDHVGFAGEKRAVDGPWRALRFRIDHTNYEHKEVEGTGEVGTTFDTTGNEVRVEAEHAPLWGMKGVVGAQVEDFDFSALGEEAFVPSTRTKRRALFGMEELPWSGGTLSAGLRVEHVKITSAGDADPGTPQFGPADERNFTLTSASLSNIAKLTPTWSLSGSLSATERAPTSFELYANGVHAATGAYERGDTTLQPERGVTLDAALQWKSGDDHLRLGVFSTRFSRFISLDATGNDITVGGDTFPEYSFTPVRARLNGIEIEGSQRLLRAPFTLDLSGKLDYTRATNLDTGEPLPRVAPLRSTLGLDVGVDDWKGRVEVDAAARQGRVPSTDNATPGYALVNLSLSRRIEWTQADALWFIKLTNLGDVLAYNASTVQGVRDLSPLSGRAVKAGLRVAF